MDGRCFWSREDGLFVLLDSETFDELLYENNRICIALLRHCNNELLDMVRSPFSTEQKCLKEVPEYCIKEEGTDNKKIIVCKSAEREEYIDFSHHAREIEKTVKKIYGKSAVGKNEIESVSLPFVLSTFVQFGKRGILITNNSMLLKNRRRLKTKSLDGPPNIMSVDEASMFLDLFFKTNNKYYAFGQSKMNKGLWYWHSMRLKIPHYTVGETYVDALANRFCCALMALDEIGIQYHSGVDNDTMDNTIYHFNYLISLITGIFDNLALQTKKNYNMNIKQPQKITLANKYKEFRNLLKTKNKLLWEHVNLSSNYIDLIYAFREKVIHREGFPKLSFAEISTEGNWEANFIKVEKEVKKKLTACKDKKSRWDPFTEWGLYETINEYYIEPYHFSLQALKELTSFVDKYLELMGCPSFFETNDKHTQRFQTFEEGHLGF